MASSASPGPGTAACSPWRASSRCSNPRAWTGWRRNEAIAAETALDGLYVIRTSFAKQQLNGPAAVAAYKSLAHVERAFRSMKTVDMQVRPVLQYGESRARASPDATITITSRPTPIQDKAFRLLGLSPNCSQSTQAQ